MRTFGYLFAGWLLFGLAMNGLVSLSGGSPGGALAGLVAAGGLVWLVRSYRQGPGAGLARELQAQLDRLAERLPADPLASAEIVAAWSVHAGDAATGERLRREYDDARRALEEAQDEVDVVRETGALRRRERLDARLARVEDYVRSIDLLAASEPDLVEHAIAEHAEAAKSVDLARLSDADVDDLLAADAKLQGARAALRRNEERPLEAIRLAAEAERIAASAARRGELPAEVVAVRRRLAVAEDGLAAAVLRHAPSALAELRGLPALAHEQLDRAHEEPAALAAARATIARIESHLSDLDRAAATARPLLEAAEGAVDAALARGGPAASRAAELTTTARELLRRERPDWLEIASLADRALALLGEEHGSDAAGSVVEQARDAREDVWAWALTSSPQADEARAVALQIDGLLDEAARLEAAGDAAGAATVYSRVVSLAAPAVQAASRTRMKRAG